MRFIASLAILFLFLGGVSVLADDSCSLISDLSGRVDCYSKKVVETQGQGRTLSSQINLLNKEISTTQLKISETEQKLGRLNSDIASVSGKIDRIEEILQHTSNVLANRIATTYKNGRIDPIVYLLSADGFSDFWRRFEYLRLVQKRDSELLFQMTTTKKNYRDQKDLFEEKKKQVEALNNQLKSYRRQLDKQTRDKESLLTITRNDEKRYQQLLTDAKRELDAIRTSQFTGKRNVTKGEVIGLMGNTGFSTGSHLHFGVYNLTEGNAGSFVYGSNSNDPLNFLSGRDVIVESGACNDKSGNTHVGVGNWNWPMNNPRISQCYGATPYSFVYANGSHDGLDVYDLSNSVVSSVDDGVAYFYRGSGSFGNNVRVFHANGKMTLYLHLQ